MCAALCLCVLCGIAAVGASAASDLPIKFSTEGKVYQYAVSKKDPDTVTYGASSPCCRRGFRQCLSVRRRYKRQP